LTILAPIAPFVSEELWERMGHKESISLATWPTYDEKELVEDEIEVIFQVNGKLKARVSVANGLSKDELEKVAFENEQIKSAIDGKTVRKVIAVPNKLVNIVAN
ncbi:class I tRNA ligase family protein, partial [Vagococcus fluvialis]|uniref:class I tRNA ligase family protein n=1 Tax=Vagococcus fluvialis TaxID=2738 RepID=UPI003B5C4F10